MQYVKNLLVFGKPLKKALIVNFMIGVLFVTSCSAPRIVAATSITADTVRVTETIRDTVVSVEPDSSMLKALLECDSLGQVRLRELIEVKAGKRMLPPTIKISNNNTLEVQASVDSMAIYLKLKDRHVEHTLSEKTTQIIEVNKLTLFQKITCNIGLLALGIIGCAVSVGIYKLIK